MGYYFISVGGSGARVLEALAHLCVAGLLPNLEKNGNFYAMAIDPDQKNGNLKRTQTLLNHIQEFQNINVGKGTPLLKTHLTLVDPTFVWSPTPQGQDLDTIISYHDFKGTSIGKLYESLYTKAERDEELDEGFRGHPSIGAAVMAKKTRTSGGVKSEQAWQKLIDTVKSDVKSAQSAQIFLAGSIFGGTGAAGLPTIARILREEFTTLGLIDKVRIGGALLLPYFSFAPTEEQKKNIRLFASSDNFLTNTKAALHYYAHTGGSGYDSIYFIGDETMAPTPNFSVGAGDQCNDAHIVDFFAAMAAVHFYQKGTKKPCYYISRNSADAFQWCDVPNVIMDSDENSLVSVQKRFVQFTRFIFAYLHIVKSVFEDLESRDLQEINYRWYVDLLKGKAKVTDDDVRNFGEYAEIFVAWLDQLEHSAGLARSVEMIHPKSFSFDNSADYIKKNHTNVKINTELFQTLGYDNSKLTVEDVKSRLNAQPVWWEKFLPRRRNNNQDLGANFGFFLRKLYDSCAVM